MRRPPNNPTKVIYQVLVTWVSLVFVHEVCPGPNRFEGRIQVTSFLLFYSLTCSLSLYRVTSKEYYTHFNLLIFLNALKHKPRGHQLVCMMGNLDVFTYAQTALILLSFWCTSKANMPDRNLTRPIWVQVLAKEYKPAFIYLSSRLNLGHRIWYTPPSERQEWGEIPSSALCCELHACLVVSWKKSQTKWRAEKMPINARNRSVHSEPRIHS